jgi:hypothetical protein
VVLRVAVARVAVICPTEVVEAMVLAKVVLKVVVEVTPALLLVPGK